jgi:hypothetical protein
MCWSVSRRVLVVVLAVVLGTACSSTLTAAPIGPDFIARLSARISYTLQLLQPAAASPSAKRTRVGPITIDPYGEETKGSNPSTMGMCIDPNGHQGSCPEVGGAG